MTPSRTSKKDAKLELLLQTASAAHQAGRHAEAEAGYKRVLAGNPNHVHALYLLGALYYQIGNHSEAAKRIDRCLQLKHDHFAAMEVRAATAAAAGDFPRALELTNKIAESSPQSPQAAFNLAIARWNMRDGPGAIAECRRALLLQPDFPEAENTLALALAQQGETVTAVRTLTECLARHPKFAIAWRSMCSILIETGQTAECAQAAGTYLSVLPDDPDAAYFLATTLRIQGQWRQALEMYRRALAGRPAFINALDECAGVLFELGEYAEAEQTAREAIDADPSAPNPHTNLGRILQRDMTRAEEALKHHDICLAARPDYADAHNNRSIALYALNRLDEAEASARRAISLKPSLAEAYSNLGNILERQGDLDSALDAYRMALSYQPNYPEAHWNTTLTLLALGQFADGWKTFDVRWKCRDFPAVDRSLGLPQLAAIDPGQGPLYVWGEQGIGDEILYGGMVPDLIERGLSPILECDERLVPLWRRSYPDLAVVGRGPQVAESVEKAGVRTQIAAGGLGRFLRPTEESFPRRSHYWRADAVRTAQYRSQLIGPAKRLIGISWISKNAALGAHKSLALTQWRDILSQPDTAFVTLQYGDTSAERADVLAELGVSVSEVPGLDLFNDIDGLAALVDACDLVITVSNTTAHVAGALGKPTWVMVPSGAGKLWYWFFNRTDSPWYPTVRIFRQSTPGSWAEPLTAVAKALGDKTATGT